MLLQILHQVPIDTAAKFGLFVCETAGKVRILWQHLMCEERKKHKHAHTAHMAQCNAAQQVMTMPSKLLCLTNILQPGCI